MNGLYKRVLKGLYPPISTKYSRELASVIAKMLVVEPKNRPSCSDILEMNFVKAKAESLNISLDDGFDPKSYEVQANKLATRAKTSDQNSEHNLLLKTIVVPRDLANLSTRLPKSNYEKSRELKVKRTATDAAKVITSRNLSQGISFTAKHEATTPPSDYSEAGQADLPKPPPPRKILDGLPSLKSLGSSKIQVNEKIK
jgi:serine/threonine protein kinase